MAQNTLDKKTFCPTCIDRIKAKQQDIARWMSASEEGYELPLYSSVDIRNAGYKMAVVDTNLFPAGFNNLSPEGINASIRFLKEAILKRVPQGRHILIIAEEHTRNTWYLENVRILEQIILQAGFQTKIATFLDDQPKFCDDIPYCELDTATGKKVKIYCFHTLLSRIESGSENFDLIIMNNDLTTGIPDVLLKSKIPIYPSIKAGWHSRLKSSHFSYAHDLLKEFSRIVDLDYWLFSCLHTVLARIDINKDSDRQSLADGAADLFAKIEAKYREHRIKDKPYIVLKSDSGTYGMGVMTIEDPKEILTLNRKNRNKLYKGKSSKIIDRYLLQEGVPTIDHVDNQTGEVVIYQVENHLVGGFYRLHSSKGDRENLNSKGMGFKQFQQDSNTPGEFGDNYEINLFNTYRILARIACIAAHREIAQLEAPSR